MERSDYILFSGGAPGAEAEFGAQAERVGIEEVNFGFEGHVTVRTRGLRTLNHEELQAGDVSLAYVSQLMNRRYSNTPTFRKVLQSIWYQVNAGTGWGAEFAKLCNKPLHVFDQSQNGWFTWDERRWVARADNDLPRIEHVHLTGTGTRTLTDAGKAAIADLFTRSFGR